MSLKELTNNKLLIEFWMVLQCHTCLLDYEVKHVTSQRHILSWYETHVLRRGQANDVSHFLGYHPHLLKVDQTVYPSVVSQFNKCQVLLYYRENWYLKRNAEIND